MTSGKLRYYVLLPNRQIAEVADALTWARWFETADRHVALTMTEDYEVSTVFLGLDHRHIGDGPPILFETMVFDRDGRIILDEVWRYSSWDDAEAGHRTALKRILATKGRVKT